MNLPDQPPTFRPPSTVELPWSWRLEDKTGAEVTVTEDYAGQRFASQADAESWVGEFYAELAEQGVDGVTLLDVDRVVYGPMSLHA
ncbi:hypothetical protein NPS01_08390 [Nocardioides psychrotolerans]|uniref:Uncharacterized protein n=1 Tax=Nocardioides psychrotolerans TaxID=1005945 RepID=A0A1I3FJW8_9ACTN|nr:hypothetical protein [Nocardioides psychrotolerans]GEP37176.1 hypothetical protein NPS01_08390 [Nocardioides psychrotolerans]SFI11513.1 hypothetical protein SAMN05216561_10519 [Nocardioides psychrotolerans]